MILSEQVVNVIFDELSSRSGFNHWWQDIEPGTREEILDKLTIEVQDLLSPLEEEAWQYRELGK